MEKKNEPLLKDVEETFPFLEENNKKEKPLKLGKELITTVIVAILVIAFVARSLYPFYIGFKYYNLRFEKDSTETVNQ